MPDDGVSSVASRLRQRGGRTHLCVARIVSCALLVFSSCSAIGCNASRFGDRCDRLLLPGDALTRAARVALAALCRRVVMVEALRVVFAT